MIQKLPTHLRSIFLLIGSFLTMLQATSAQGVAINTDNTDPDASAALDVKSTSKGVLVPRMTQAQRNAIATPATGLMIFQTNNTPGFYYYTGSAWSAVGGGGSSASLQLVATNIVSQSVAAGSSVTAPSTVNFANVVTSPTLGTWTSNNTFTVGASGAGVYMINVALVTTTATGVAPLIVVNGTPVMLGVPFNNTNLPTNTQGRGIASITTTLSAGDVITVQCSNISTTTAAQFSTSGTTMLTIVKLL